MTAEETTAGNELIAEFMGLVQRNENTWWDENKTASHGLFYHSSWDDLMPVVEKIEELIEGKIEIRGGCYINYSYSPKKFTHFAGVGNPHNKWKEARTPFESIGGKFHQIHVSYPLKSAEKLKAETKILAVWLAVTKWIIWYNKTVKK